jgi:hypothetical protein
MHDPAGRTIAWPLMVAEPERDWAGADVAVNVNASTNAVPRIIPSPSAKGNEEF